MNISYNDAKYLKHSGRLIDVKVSIAIIDRVVYIHIRDYEFVDFKSALQCLQRIANEELISAPKDKTDLEII